MGATVLTAVIGLITTIAGSVAAWFGGRRGRAAVAQRDEAEAAESLAGTVAALGEQVRMLYAQLAATEMRAMMAERRAAAAEHEVGILRGEVARLQVQVAQQGHATS